MEKQRNIEQDNEKTGCETNTRAEDGDQTSNEIKRNIYDLSYMLDARSLLDKENAIKDAR